MSTATQLTEGPVDWSNAEYHADRECDSASTINQFLSDPLTYHLQRQGQWASEASEAMTEGSAVGVYLLEPDKVEQLIEMEPEPAGWGQCSATTTKNARCSYNACGPEGLCKRHGGEPYTPTAEIVLKPEQQVKCQEMAEAVRRHEVARWLIDTATHREQAFRWQDPETGLWLKTKPDLLGANWFADLKTTRHVAVPDFLRHAYNLGYHRQAAFYRMGLIHLGLLGADSDFRWIVCSNPTPSNPCIYVHVLRLADRAMALGAAEVRQALRELADRRERDDWSQPDGDVAIEVDLPAYAYPREDRVNGY